MTQNKVLRFIFLATHPWLYLIYILRRWQQWEELIPWPLQLDDYMALRYKGGLFSLQCNVWRNFDLQLLWA